VAERFPDPAFAEMDPRAGQPVRAGRHQRAGLSIKLRQAARRISTAVAVAVAAETNRLA